MHWHVDDGEENMVKEEDGPLKDWRAGLSFMSRRWNSGYTLPIVGPRVLGELHEVEI